QPEPLGPQRDGFRPFASPSPAPSRPGIRKGTGGSRFLTSRPRRSVAGLNDLEYVNGDPAAVGPLWASLPRDQWEKIEARIRRTVQVRDDFVQIPFPRLVSASKSDAPIAAAIESYKREAAIVDPRLSREVTCAFKAAALSDLCDRLRAETGIQLA